MQPFYISPSRIARYFYHECERYLRYHATPRERRTIDGVPSTSWDTSPVTAAILEGGFVWERNIIEKKLRNKVKIAKGTGPLNERVHDIKDSLTILKELKTGEAIYQPTFKAPDSFLARYNIPSELCEFPPCRPDLLQLVEDDGDFRLRVIDVKASTSLKISHRIQVTTYALILRDIVKNNGITKPLDLNMGGVWLYGSDEPEWFNLRFSILTLEEFFSNKLPRILKSPINELPWHLFFRCEWCEFYPHCRKEAESKKSISLIPYLSIGGRKYLRETPWGGDKPINTLNDLEDFLKEPEAEDCLDACGSLRCKGERLRNSIAALKSGGVIPHGGSSLALPIMEDVKVFITVQDDPVTGQIYVAGFARTKAKDVFGQGIKEAVFVAEKPEECSKIKKQFLTALFDELNTLHRFNQNKEWSKRKSMQTYVYDSYELRLFNQLLQDSLFDPELSEIAIQLLFHYQDTSLMEADEHPAEEVNFPVIVITEVLRRLLALPIPVSFRLPEVLNILPSPNFNYNFTSSKLFWFELSNVLRSDSIYMAWNKNKKEALQWIKDEVIRRLRGASAILDGLREKVGDLLFAWPQKFSFPDSMDFVNPEFSRLVFITRYETMMGAIETRMKRSLPWTERIREGISIHLRKEQYECWEVLSEIDQTIIEESGDFFTFLLVPTGNIGEKAQLAYDDYRNRSAFWPPKGPVRLAKILRYKSNPATGLVTHLFLELIEDNDQPAIMVKEEAVLHPRFTDFNSNKIVKYLAELDKIPKNDLLLLLRDPVKFASGSSVFSNFAKKTLEIAFGRSGFTTSQFNALRHVLSSRLTLIWGPPGTGKTHFLAKAILCMALAMKNDDRYFQVAVTAFTHAAIENLLAEIKEYAPAFGLENMLEIRKLKKISTPRGRNLEVVSEKGVKYILGRKFLIIGGTIYGLYKSGLKGHFPFLVVDEASQMKFGEFAMGLSTLSSNGNIILAGDDLQLPPILKGIYPEPEDGLPGLQSSVFAYLRARDIGKTSYTCQLTENWRMNSTLSRFPAETLYGLNYRPANADIANQKISLKKIFKNKLNSKEINICDWLLDPEFPLVICITDGIQATIENPIEAELVAKLSFFLRERLCKFNDDEIYPDNESGDWEFWRRGLFIVSPHHAQIRAILRELSKLRRWKSPAFVDTVDKIQGQQSHCVIVSYGVSDIETALSEAEFIYSLNRINVSVSRARSKCIVFLSQPLLEPAFDIMQNVNAVKGLEHMHALLHFCKNRGEKKEFELDFLYTGNGGRLKVYRAKYDFVDILQ